MSRGLSKIPILLWLLVTISCSPGEGTEGPGINEIEDLKTKQYAIQGQQLYLQYCSNCHQEDGSGLARLIPPLKKADYMLDDIDRTIRLIKMGISGEIIVNGTSYDQPMPGYPQLTNLEIAQISTYIYNVWGNKKGLVPAERVNTVLENASNIPLQ
ncbi:Cytochrome C oxidase, cbb3-type, subunit III [Cyclobacterium lianum]|uniref:Cytochrome C oxidase, cbb3-type, subunit III n=1 Tax=Cyclobacterium lianum TaxID=388280 RepID=A0A1M7PDS4_9BACT|nr:cytochrome c [Cyclobacterium lianum]SHN15111.1 Cytochrome C oxidase, cbb3-type, subunit III [Cyclobacterium lianum]